MLEVHARIQTMSEGVQLCKLFLVDEGESIPIQLKAGHHRPASFGCCPFQGDGSVAVDSCLLLLPVSVGVLYLVHVL